MEIEAKFRVSDRRVFTGLLRLTTLAGANLIPQSAAEYQTTTYFDTADDRLRARGASLRVREVAGRRVATVKRSRGLDGLIHLRDEWEVPIAAELSPLHWPASPARSHALALVGHEPLFSRVRVFTRRQIITLGAQQRPLAELCLDEGHVAAGGRIETFRELEVELLAAGTRADLDRICAALMVRFPLEPEPLGKRTRGLRLLDTSTPARRTPEFALELAQL
ncbi:MAG: CYTH domain-containing protein [Oscillochloris sp.]|nr:CYTH domain-containing protein [Oscillochloris sp.]